MIWYSYKTNNIITINSDFYNYFKNNFREFDIDETFLEMLDTAFAGGLDKDNLPDYLKEFTTKDEMIQHKLFIDCWTLISNDDIMTIKGLDHVALWNTLRLAVIYYLAEPPINYNGVMINNEKELKQLLVRWPT